MKWAILTWLSAPVGSVVDQFHFELVPDPFNFELVLDPFHFELDPDPFRE